MAKFQSKYCESPKDNPTFKAHNDESASRPFCLQITPFHRSHGEFHLRRSRTQQQDFASDSENSQNFLCGLKPFCRSKRSFSNLSFGLQRYISLNWPLCTPFTGLQSPTHMASSSSLYFDWRVLAFAVSACILCAIAVLVGEQLRKRFASPVAQRPSWIQVGRRCVTLGIKGIVICGMLEKHHAYLVNLPRTDPEKGDDATQEAAIQRLSVAECAVILRCGHVIALGTLAPWTEAAASTEKCSVCVFHTKNPLELLQLLRDHVIEIHSALQAAVCCCMHTSSCWHRPIADSAASTPAALPPSEEAHPAKSKVLLSFEGAVELLKDRTCAVIDAQSAFTTNIGTFDGERVPSSQMLAVLQQSALCPLRHALKACIVASKPPSRVCDLLAIERLRAETFSDGVGTLQPVFVCYETMAVKFATQPPTAPLPDALIQLNAAWNAIAILPLRSTGFRLFCEIVQALGDLCSVLATTYRSLQHVELLPMRESPIDAEEATCMVCLEPRASPAAEDALVQPPCDCTFMHFHRICLLKILGANAGLCKRCQVRCIPAPTPAKLSDGRSLTKPTDAAEFCDILVSCAVILAIFCAYPRDAPLASFYATIDDSAVTSARMKAHLKHIISYSKHLNSVFVHDLALDDEIRILLDGQLSEFFDTFFVGPATSLLNDFCVSIAAFHSNFQMFTASELQLRAAYGKFSNSDLGTAFECLVRHLNDGNGTRRSIFKVILSINEANSLSI